eukprot:COSAG03_NODE_516_length_7263_cov_69.317884_4_plen_70_part_00
MPCSTIDGLSTNYNARHRSPIGIATQLKGRIFACLHSYSIQAPAAAAGAFTSHSCSSYFVGLAAQQPLL